MNLKIWPTGEYLARSILVVGGFGKYSMSTVENKRRGMITVRPCSVYNGIYSKGCEGTSMCLGQG